MSSDGDNLRTLVLSSSRVVNDIGIGKMVGANGVRFTSYRNFSLPCKLLKGFLDISAQRLLASLVLWADFHASTFPASRSTSCSAETTACPAFWMMAIDCAICT
ncbi:hypothetical protein XFF6992_370221 [Xanthomonas citri pv. fuscans]|nr:hypothetical protein XFF6990_290008 [Xanthomonas citri pv. fuscans]SOO19921.1 hypothetical protein XFF6992_370221 [Xanthomonas citri pv. fuscans]SOO33957.1 hypothetical protein XFF6994_3300017 [Xanthomonas citri pv. fuscans]SOO35944.1 hypothetical protein XFF6994_670004 [Xanthomonas citri pv. fuscans]